MNKKIIVAISGIFLLDYLFKREVKINVNNNSHLSGGIATSTNTNNNQSASVSAAEKQGYNVMNDKTKPRGIRNNNPGNIKKGNDAWVGMSANQYDSTFIVFTSPHYGLRALARVLKTYKRKHKIDTVAGIIQRFSATDQSSYIINVANALGVNSSQKIDIEKNIYKLMTAIIKQENGYNPYSPNEIQAAIAAA